jgi:hypothetical protein
MRTLILALGATLLVGVPALIVRRPVLPPAQVRRPLILTRRLPRILRVTLALAVAAACPRYATALFVTLLTRNLHQWQEEFRLGAFVMWGVGVVVHIGNSRLRALRSPWRLMQLRARARRHLDRGGMLATVLSACSTAVVILVSAGVSAAFELNQVRTTHYGWLSNRCGSRNETPGDCISTKGHTERFRANISSDGSFEHPTTLAVSAQCLHGRRACPITRTGYLRSGDLVFIPDLGWFRVEDTCGACEAGQSNEGAIALWTATASGTGIQPSQLDQSRPTIHVFHPWEPIPDALKKVRANPDIWQPSIWTNARYMTGASAPSLFVDRHLRQIPASVPARSATPAETTARRQDATRPVDRTRPPVQPRPQDPARPQEAETTDGSAAVDWLLNGRQ